MSQNNGVPSKSKSCLLISGRGNEVFYSGGDPDWADWLSFDERNRSFIRGSVTAVSMNLSFTYDDTYVILATQQNALRVNYITATIAVIILIVSLACAALLIMLAFNLKRMVAVPTKELLKANHEIISGNNHYQITADAGSEEFGILFSSFNKMTTQIVNLRIESYDRLLREQDNKLMLLRAQIKPHFFLNAITTVSNMTYQNRLEDIRSYLQSLSKFVRYMLNSQRKWVTVNEEISHILNYLQMQKLRFPGSINAQIDCPENIGGTHIPILVLFTLVENAFKHAMSLYEPLELKICCRRIETDDFSGSLLAVEDNGDGFPEELLENISETTDYESMPKDHFGLSNIRYTLQLTYNRSDLLRLSNTRDGGAHVEVWIPDWEVNEQ
jgi:sensor histidine kinase YesM